MDSAPPPITVDELVARMRVELSRGDGARAQAWSAAQNGLSIAQQNADIGTSPPLRPWQGALRPVARTAARAVLFLSRFIIDAQTRFNVSIVKALTALVAGTRRLETVSVAHAEQTDARLRDLEHTLWRLQADLARLDQQGLRPPPPVLADGLDDGALDDLYVALEDRFRGSRADITTRLRAYLPLLEATGIQTRDHLLDLGCGRGEWLELTREHGWHAQGIDANRAMIARCRALSLDVVQADAVTFLRGLAPASVAVLTAFHLVEHLSFPALVALFSEAARVLRRDGLLLFETPNPDDPRTAMHDFYLDPTHCHPLPPPLLTFLAEAKGFDRITLMSADTNRSGVDYTLIARKP